MKIIENYEIIYHADCILEHEQWVIWLQPIQTQWMLLLSLRNILQVAMRQCLIQIILSWVSETHIWRIQWRWSIFTFSSCLLSEQKDKKDPLCESVCKMSESITNLIEQRQQQPQLKYLYMWQNLDRLFQKMSDNDVDELNMEYLRMAYAKIKNIDVWIAIIHMISAECSFFILTILIDYYEYSEINK